MPYTPITTLSRRGEKVATFFSLQNITGIVVLAGPTWVITESLPGALRFGLVLLTAVVGYLVTMDVFGMALYERVVWRVRGQIRSLVRGRRITPADLPGMALARVTTIATLRGGPFQRHRTAPLPAPHARAALTARTATAYRQALLRVADPGDDHDSGGIHAHGAAEDHGADRTALKLSH